MVYFEKSTPAPACLAIEEAKKSGDYKCGNVLNRIKEDFKNKCYICECREPNSINVEHLRPHQGNKHLEFNWGNLFWSCFHCNNTKSNRYTDIINCTNQAENIEGRIKLSMKPFPKEMVVVEALDTQASTVSTKNLLEAIYGGTTNLKRMESANLRDKILDDIMDFQGYLNTYYKGSSSQPEKDNALLKIRSHLSKVSNFTAFKRWIIRENTVLMNDLGQYFD